MDAGQVPINGIFGMWGQFPETRLIGTYQNLSAQSPLVGRERVIQGVGFSIWIRDGHTFGSGCQ
jgi:hypothetical protein